jgi:Holliday junction resolvasome RuvABC endonuclease subunit
MTGNSQNVFPIFIGLDPGENNFGWAVVAVCRGKYTCIERGKIEFSSLGGRQKLRRIVDKYCSSFDTPELIDGVFYALRGICCENPPLSYYQYVSKRDVQVKVSQERLYGHVEEIAEVRGVELFRVLPHEIKLATAGSENVTKDSVKNAVNLMVNIHEEDYDICDAVGSCIAGYFNFIQQRRNPIVGKYCPSQPETPVIRKINKVRK